MINRILKSLLIIFTLTITNVQGQSVILSSKFLSIDVDQKTKENLLSSIDGLFQVMDSAKLDSTLINKEYSKLTTLFLNSLRGNENTEKDSLKIFYKREIINLYPISNTEYFISVAYLASNNDDLPILKTIFNLIAKNENGKFVFSIPIKYETKTWKIKRIGNITYHFPDSINVENGKIFDKKNKTIATKFDLTPEKFDFYLCDNYQEILKLFGYEYDMESNGTTRSGSGPEANTIFSVMHNEDFSHDLFHYYSAKIRTNKRNWFAEEGFAYCWGNAYWNKPNGETITQDELVGELQKYLKNNPQTILLDMFDNQPKVFKYLSNEISLKKILSSIICKEVERIRGITGVKELLNCGSGEDNFFKSTDKLVHINRLNFNEEVMKLINEYK